MRVGEQLEQAVDEALRAGYARLRGMHGYGSQAHQGHPTHRIEGAGRATWAFDEQIYGGKLAEDQKSRGHGVDAASNPEKTGSR